MVRLSMCLIVGDAHVKCLARCLKSLLIRPEGPACDEIVIGWNGKNDDGFRQAVVEGTGEPWWTEADLSVARVATLASGVRVVVHCFEWTNDFAAARNLNFSKASGIWRGYVDADDILATADHPAYADSLEQDPPRDGHAVSGQLLVFPENCRLPDFLAKLPEHINVVWAPYNYMNSDRGRPVTRNRRGRIVKWDPYWAWISEVHEQLRHALGREIPTWCPGVLFVHDHDREPDIPVDRIERNTAIIEEQISRLQQLHLPVPAMGIYALASTSMNEHRFAEAADLFFKAAEASGDREERHLFSLQSHRAAIEAGEFQLAGERALDAIRYMPERPEGYFAAAEASYKLLKHEACVRWYEQGKDKTVGVAPMTDDRLSRCLRPVRHAGVAYLRIGKYKEALEIAEKALKEAPDEFAEKIKTFALEGLRVTAIADGAKALAKTLAEAGFPARALRVLSIVEDVAGSPDLVRTVRQEVEKKVPRDMPSIPDNSVVSAWFASADPEDIVIRAPIDAVEQEELSALFRDAAESVPEGKSLLVCSTDPYAGDSYALRARLDALSAEKLLAHSESVGSVEDLSLVEDPKGTGSRFLVSRTKVGRVRGTPTPDVTFWCPVFAEPWGPWRVLKDGTGGSEEAVVYVARELAQRGLNVQVFAPLDHARHRGVHVEGGVRWRHLDSFDPSKRVPGITVACRAPWAVRLPSFDLDRLYIWHQDAEYTMGWDPAIAKAVKHFWVSQWQRESLLKQIGLHAPMNDLTRKVGVDDMGVVCGDAIPQSALDVPWGERDPLSCVYISSPLRGLLGLLDLWPLIRAQFPEATLRVYYGWETVPAAFGQVSRYQTETMRRIRTMRGVEWVGRIPQHEIEQDLVKRSVWLYPCVTGDTKISMPCDHRKHPDGVPIADLVGRTGFPVWSFDETRCEFVLATASKVWKTKEVTELVEVVLDDGAVLRVTPEHRLMDFNGVWKEARHFTAGERLMALHYRYDVAVKDAHGRWESESRAVGAWKEGRELSSKEHVDHEDPTRLDNTPERLNVLSASAHASKTFAGQTYTAKRQARMRAGSKRRWERELATEESRQRVKKALSSVASAFWASMSPEERAAFVARRAEKTRVGVKSISVEAKARQKAGADRGREARWASHRANGENHRIVVVRTIKLDEPIAVYDMTVEGTHNFIANGVVAHNCIFPEGYCIAGVRAAAAGLIPVYRRVAAMGECQYPSQFSVPDSPWDETGRREFAESAVAALQTAKDWHESSETPNCNRQAYRNWASTKTWGNVAEAMIAEFLRSGLFGVTEDAAG